MTNAADLAKQAYDALHRGAPEARARFAKAIAAAPEELALRIGDAEARFAGGEARPWSGLDPILINQPEWIEGQNIRAALRWECAGDADFADGFRDALKRLPRFAPLWNAYITALAGAGNHTAAADAARDARAFFNAPVLRLIEASHSGHAGDLARANALLATLPLEMPERGMVDVRQALRDGRPEVADRVLARLRAASPEDLSVWALSDLTWRLLNDDRADWLGGQAGLVQTIELPLSSPSLAALVDILRPLHRFRSQPMGQSVRGGTQTRGPLFERHEAAIQMLKQALQSGVDDYVSRLAAYDPEHPLLRHRNRRVVVSGGWSVRLSAAGFHVAHLHPAGILSSACYIAVPPLEGATHEGWLELGAAPADLRMNLPPRKLIEPRPARLALFPSYLYHGTRPFRAGERLTVAFDAS